MWIGLALLGFIPVLYQWFFSPTIGWLWLSLALICSLGAFESRRTHYGLTLVGIAVGSFVALGLTYLRGIPPSADDVRKVFVPFIAIALASWILKSKRSISRD